MRYILENEFLKVQVDDHGAELRGVYGKAEAVEYMWQADPAFWGRTSPVLFPFVGSLKNKQYTHEGKVYSMGQHGFARDMDFTLVSQTENELWFRLTDTAETLEKYPFRFVLELGYRLNGRAVTVLWRVHNPDSKPMHFSIGAHPAFNCPIGGEKDKTGYRVAFGGKESIYHHGITAAGLSLRERIDLPMENGTAVLSPAFFDRCYLIEDRQANEVSLITPEGKTYVTVRFDTPLFALWSPEGKNAPFVCIEPWFGRCDAVDFEGTLADREYGNTVNGGETFETSYEIVFG